jgi:phosphatidylglycerol:prolipoprotein diacylglycerol transferase
LEAHIVAADCPTTRRAPMAASPPPTIRRPVRSKLDRSAAIASAALDWLADQVVLFRAGDLVFVTFGLFAALGTLFTLTGMGVILLGQGMEAKTFLGLSIFGSATIVLASWLLGQLLDFRLVLENPREALQRPIFVSWGGVFGLPIVFGLFSWLSDFSLLLLLDALARTLPIGHALGRLGCLSYGCCFGRPTERRLAITYRNPHAKAVRVGDRHNVRLHPAALYEAVLDLGILLAVYAAVAVAAPVGVPAAVAIVLYAVGRFAIEFVKDNHGRTLLGRLAVNHICCLLMLALGVLVLHFALATPHLTPAVAWPSGVEALRELLPVIVPCTLAVFIGFSLHRGRVGAW